jgi:hypothetical protein
VTGWTVLAGCGKTTLARENFEGSARVVQQQNTPAGCSKRPFSKAAGESKPEAYPLGYVEDFDEPRTTLADFFSILLESGQRLMTISRATLPLGPKGF